MNIRYLGSRQANVSNTGTPLTDVLSRGISNLLLYKASEVVQYYALKGVSACTEYQHKHNYIPLRGCIKGNCHDINVI